MSGTLVHKGLKLDKFCPPSVNSAFYFIAMQALQTEISKRNSTKLCQTVDRPKSRYHTGEKSGASQKNGGKNIDICSVFRRL